EVAAPCPRDLDDPAAGAVGAGGTAGAAGRKPVGLTLAGTRADAPGSLRRAAALAALAVGLGGIDVALAHHALARRDAALRTTIAAEAAAALPGTPIVAARAQLEAAAAAALRREVRLGARTSVLDVLRELSER